MDAEALYPQSIRTSQGKLHFQKPHNDLIRSLYQCLPMGLRMFSEPQRGASFGIVVKRGEQEMHFLKQQPPEIEEVHTATVLQANSLLLGVTFAQYLAHGHTGWFWPSVYLKQKRSGVELGIAYAGGGDLPEEGVDATSRAFDNSLGEGFTLRMMDFVESLKAQAQITSIPLQPTIGLDVRARSQLGSLAFGFLFLDQTVICLKAAIREEDPIWTVIRSSGIDTLVHLPAVPLELPA